MEDVLAKIMKDSSASKHSALRQSCTETQEFLANQHGLLRSPPYEVRNKCLITLQLALESKHNKLISHALSGLQRLVWDKNFQSAFESDDDELWLPCQLLRAVSSLPTQHEDVQVEMLKIFLQMTCTSGYSLSSRAVIQLISLCGQAYSFGSPAVCTAIQATVSQTLQSFCMALQECDEEAYVSGESDDENACDLLEVINEDLCPVLSFICKKMKDLNNTQGKSTAPLHLQCILSILSNLKTDVHQSTTFLNFVWQELCPLLVAMLGSPKTDKNIISSQKSGCTDANEVGRGSGCLAVAPSCQSAEAKTIYSIAINLVRLIGGIGSLRPVLESVFHRMLLYPPPQHRLEALKSVKELMKTPELLVHFAAPPLYLENDKSSRSGDMNLLRIVMDSLGECCHSSDNNVCYTTVSCVVSLMNSLEIICSGAKIPEAYTKLINRMFKTVDVADYKGAKSECWFETKHQETCNIMDKSERCEKFEPANIIVSSEEKEKCGKFEPMKILTLSEEKDVDIQIKNPMMSLLPGLECAIAETKEEMKEPLNYSVAEVSEHEIMPDANHCMDNNLDTDTLNESMIIAKNTPCAEDVCVHDSAACDTIPGKDDDYEGRSDTSSPNIAAAIADVVFQDDENLPAASDKEGLDKSSSTSEDQSESADIDIEEMSYELKDQERELAERETCRRMKAPRTLLGQEDAGKEERERVERLCEARLEFAQLEQQNACRFVKILQSFLPRLLAIHSSIEADQALQEFSSNYCEGLWQSQQGVEIKNSLNEDGISYITIMNADGIYLATYSALSLNLKLIRSHYYSEPCGDIPLTEVQFIEEVHGSGVLVYLSATWLAELYQQILVINLLEAAGYCPTSLENSAVINLLTDVDGLENTIPGAQLLADYRRLERAVANIQISPAVEAGMKFGRRVLTCCWNTVLEVLSVLLNGTNSCGISSSIGFLLGTEGAKEEHRKAKDAIIESLDGLQMVAKLFNALGLQAHCSAVFSQLAAASCPLSKDFAFSQLPLHHSEYKQQLKKALLPYRSKTLRLHTSHILSMDAILNKGLELGSHCSECWKYVFQCCMFVLDLEHTFFSGHGHVTTMISRPTLASAGSAAQRDAIGDDLFPFPPFDADTSDYGKSLPGKTKVQKLNVSDMITNGAASNTSGIIKGRQLWEIIEGLSQSVDRLFEEAASRLNLSALIGFLVELCAASQVQLFNKNFSHFVSSNSHGNSLLMYHLGDIMLRCARGGRPLIHVMKSWSVVAPHFVEAACHKDRVISKKAVTIIHDVVSTFLYSNSELPHFHFNEALFKPFENLLCLELCDTDIQEQIISSICEFVEGCTTEIHSGWRPLFGALRAVRIPEFSKSCPSIEHQKEQTHHLRVVLDVFEFFLGTNNVLVFAYAAVDCLLCLLKHVRGSEVQDSVDKESSVDVENPVISLDMCLSALKYLERCANILSSMYSMPTCPVFNSANRIRLRSEPNIIDSVIPGLEMIYFNEKCSTQSANHSCTSDKYCDLNYVGTEMDNLSWKESVVSLEKFGDHSGILHVWFLLLEGLAGAIANCQRRYQPYTMETLFSMLRSVKKVPGPFFGVYCVNHLLLPMLQNWLRRVIRSCHDWENFAANFKQCCGLAADLIVDYIQCMTEELVENSPQYLDIKLMLHQLLLFLTECVALPNEMISRLGCSCIKHTIMAAGNFFTSELWEIVCRNLQRACKISLHSVKQLMVAFHPDSDSFYGDLGEVQVAARKDCTSQESERLRQLSYQVFLLDCQRTGYSSSNTDNLADEEKSFTFLIHPPVTSVQDYDGSTENIVVRVPFHSLVVALLSHQILLQTIGTIMLQGTSHLLPSLMTLLPSTSLEKSNSSLNDSKSYFPGFLGKLTSMQTKMLLDCLSDSYEIACEFDFRPGLKFLIQKVALMDVAANLYKQAGISWTTQILVLFEICLHIDGFSMEKVNSLISLPFVISEECDDPATNHVCSHDCQLHFKNIRFNAVVRLKEKFKDICETYIEMAVDQDGSFASADKIVDQPIFFLIAQPDEISEYTSCEKRTSDSHFSADVRETGKLSLSNHNSCDNSDSENLAMPGDDEDKIYKVATEQTIYTLINEYKKRKMQHTMPSAFKEKFRRKSNSSDKPKSSISDCSVSEEINIQRRASIMKDGEAHIQVWKQLIQSVFDLHHSLPNEDFKAFLPIIFPGVECLVACATDPDLRLIISNWLNRLAVCCGFLSSPQIE